MADPPSELHKVTSITTTDYLDAMPTPSAGFGVLVVSKQTTYESLESRSRNDRPPTYSKCRSPTERSLTYSMRASPPWRLLRWSALGLWTVAGDGGWLSEYLIDGVFIEEENSDAG